MNDRISIQSKGGKARDRALSPEQKSNIGKKGATARWSKPRATHDGELKIGDLIIPCAVLEGGTRVLSQSGFLKALGRSERPSGAYIVEGSTLVGAANLKPFVSSDLLSSLKPVDYISAGRKKALGFKAEILPEICEVYLKAREAKVLHYTQEGTAQAAEIVIRGLARIGIVALVDEATGYQDERAKDALAQILEKFIAKELQPWTKTFPLAFYEEIFRLKDWKFDPEKMAKMQGPRVLGKYTNDIVYDRLAPGVRDELEKNNPKIDGRRKTKHHQWLTGEIGHPKLMAHIESVKALMMVSENWEEFKNRLKKVYPKKTLTELGMEIEEA